MTIWIVNMGLGEKCDQKEAMRVFSTYEAAVKWVQECFKENIQELKGWDGAHGLHIGNSFYIYPMEVDLKY